MTPGLLADQFFMVPYWGYKMLGLGLELGSGLGLVLELGLGYGWG